MYCLRPAIVAWLNMSCSMRVLSAVFWWPSWDWRKLCFAAYAAMAAVRALLVATLARFIVLYADCSRYLRNRWAATASAAA